MSQFGFRASPNTQSAVSSGASQSPPAAAVVSTSSTSSMAVTSTAPSAAAVVATTTTSPSTPPPHGQQRCCDTGRPIFSDPITGQTVCSCQYELLGGYQRLAGGVPGLPALSMYSAPYPDGMAAYFPALGADQAPFYTSTAAGLELKENLAAGAATWPYPSVYHPYDAAFAGYPFNGYGMDLNGARRKNATRETTSTLKAWLNDHKKNPYPTKGEKIMLAIITKMTLTQVSTWFANARRRLKKENKMTWEPRNRVEDEDNNNDDDDEHDRKSSTDGKDLIDSKDSGTASSEDGDRPPHPRLHGPDTGSEWSESRPDSGPDSPDLSLYDHHHHNHHHHHHRSHPAFLPPRSSGSPPALSGSAATKPRIWSLADMASKEDVSPQPIPPPPPPPPPAPPSASSSFYTSAAAVAAAAAAGRLMTPLAGGRLPPPGLHSSPFAVRSTHDFYRSLYGPPTAGGSEGETYSRNLLGTAHPALAKAAAAAAAAAASSSHHLQPLALSTNTARMSPSSTSSISSGSETPLKPVALNKA